MKPAKLDGETHGPIRIGALQCRINDEVTCPVCGDPITSQAFWQCPRCHTPHHVDCWEYNEGCAIYGCGRRASPRSRVRPLPPQAPHPAVSDPPLWQTVLWGLLKVAGFMAVTGIVMAIAISHPEAARKSLTYGTILLWRVASADRESS